MIRYYVNNILLGDCRHVMAQLPSDCISACITDPPYNYEFIGHTWNEAEIKRRMDRAHEKGSKTLVKHIPYGSGLAGGTRNASWYKRNRANILDYENWCFQWASELFRVCKPGATVLAFNSTRTVAHLQVALEKAGFYARDILVYRRPSGIPKGANIKKQLEKKGYPDAAAWEDWHSCLRNEWEAICILQKPLKNDYASTFIEYGTGLFYTKSLDGGFQSNILEHRERRIIDDYNIHCTIKPVSLMKRLIEIFVPKTENCLLLDPFAGSGSTLVAAQALEIPYLGIEIIPEYIDIIKKRLSLSVATP
ncbi:MAG: site-specific DNA-methyltransferase [Pseudomonadales bacterium]|nr:site-specific DNA-methyltransferase [Pseudomonadales bacterium]